MLATLLGLPCPPPSDTLQNWFSFKEMNLRGLHFRQSFTRVLIKSMNSSHDDSQFCIITTWSVWKTSFSLLDRVSFPDCLSKKKSKPVSFADHYSWGNPEPEGIHRNTWVYRWECPRVRRQSMTKQKGVFFEVGINILLGCGFTSVGLF